MRRLAIGLSNCFVPSFLGLIYVDYGTLSTGLVVFHFDHCVALVLCLLVRRPGTLSTGGVALVVLGEV
jgi:hypothetical protein